jgi:hypothetical protein
MIFGIFRISNEAINISIIRQEFFQVISILNIRKIYPTMYKLIVYFLCESI